MGAITRLERLHAGLYGQPVSRQMRTSRAILRFVLAQGGFPAFFRVDITDSNGDPLTYEHYQRLYRLTQRLVEAYDEKTGVVRVRASASGSRSADDLSLLVRMGVWTRVEGDGAAVQPNLWMWVSLAHGYQQERQAYHLARWEEEVADITIEGA